MELWPHQIETYNAIFKAWEQGAKNVMAVLPTGSGKTYLFTKIMHDLGVPAVSIAHRQELIGQHSLALAAHGVRHRIIGPNKAIRVITRRHTRKFGRSYYDPNALIGVASVDTIIRRVSQLADWTRRVRLVVSDEGHHIQKGNKWGRAAAMFPNARGLAVTATACRGDGRGLGRDTDGIIDKLVVGQSMRQVINAGYLTDYRIYSLPTAGLELSRLKVGNSGDYVREQMVEHVRATRIVGNIVEHYQRIAPGKLGVTFVTDVKTAHEVAVAYNTAGVPAQAVSNKTPDAERVSVLERFEKREILQLVNVDLFGEGFDLPALEVCSMARPTASFGLYCQQFGRGLRIMKDKGSAIILDHVGNVARHGLPDTRNDWTLSPRERRQEKDPNVIPVRVCPNPICALTYERIYRACPYCGFEPVSQERSTPEFVEGDLEEIDPVILAQLRGEIARVDMTPEQFRLDQFAKGAHPMWTERNLKSHTETQQVQIALRSNIAQWAGYQRSYDRPDSESYRRFYFRYGVDVLTAQALKRDAARKLSGRIVRDLIEGVR